MENNGSWKVTVLRQLEQVLRSQGGTKVSYRASPMQKKWQYLTTTARQQYQNQH